MREYTLCSPFRANSHNSSSFIVSPDDGTPTILHVQRLMVILTPQISLELMV